MKKQYLVRTAQSRLVLFILINIMVGRAAADELSSAAETAIAGDTTALAAVQSLQQSFAQQREFMAIQSKLLELQKQ